MTRWLCSLSLTAALLCGSSFGQDAGTRPAADSPAADSPDQSPAGDHPVVAEVRKQLGDRSPDQPFILLVALKIKEGQRQPLLAAMKTATEATRQEPGNVRYQLLADPSDPLVFQLSEHWKTVGDLQRHMQTPHLQSLLTTLDQILAEPPGLKVLVPARLKLNKK